MKRAQYLDQLADGPERDIQEEHYRNLQQKEQKAIDDLTALQEAAEDAVERLKILRQRAAIAVVRTRKEIESMYEDIKQTVLMTEMPHARGDRPTAVVITLLLVAMDIVSSSPEIGNASESSVTSALSKVLKPLAEELEIRSVVVAHGWEDHGFAAPPTYHDVRNDLFGAIGRRLGRNVRVMSVRSLEAAIATVLRDRPRTRTEAGSRSPIRRATVAVRRSERVRERTERVAREGSARAESVQSFEGTRRSGRVASRPPTPGGSGDGRSLLAAVPARPGARARDEGVGGRPSSPPPRNVSAPRHRLRSKAPCREVAEPRRCSQSRHRRGPPQQ